MNTLKYLVVPIGWGCWGAVIQRWLDRRRKRRAMPFTYHCDRCGFHLETSDPGWTERLSQRHMEIHGA